MQRPRQHVMEEESEQLLKNLLPSHWLVRKIDKDYGVDYEIEIVDETIVTGKRIWVQLKSKETCEVKIIKNGEKFNNYISFQLPIKYAKYAFKCGFPLLLFLADLSCKKIFYVNIRDEITENIFPRKPDWDEQDSISLKIPEDNSIEIDSHDDFSDLRWFAEEPILFGKMHMLSFLSKEFKYKQQFHFAEYADNTIDDQSSKYLVDTFNLIIKTIEHAGALDERFVTPETLPNNIFEPLAYFSQLSLSAAEVCIKLIESKQFTWSHLTNKIFEAEAVIEKYSLAYDLYLMAKKGLLFSSERFED